MGVANLYNLMMANFGARYNYNPSFENIYPTRNSASPSSGLSRGNFHPTVQQQPVIPTPVDSYTPSPKRPDLPEQDHKPEAASSSVGAEKREKHNEDSEHEKRTNRPESEQATYSFERRARLDYSMDLRFELAAFTRAVEDISEGDSEKAMRLAAAGFGFGADLSFNGTQTALSSGGDNAATPTVKKQSLNSSRLAGRFSKHSNNFALEGFYKEAFSIRRSSIVINSAKHQMAVNKFASRFQMDTKFSFSFLERFSEQTRQTAVERPDDVNRYVESAGNVAETGTPEMMDAFFDGVDGFLNGAEEAITAKATAMFDEAAANLGFEGAIVDYARDRFVGTIDQFFDRVDNAISSIRGRFVSSEPNRLVSQTPVPETQTVPNRHPSVAEKTSNLLA